MFSADKSVRQNSTERLKYASGAQFLLGVGIFVCAIVAVTKQNDSFYTYFIGGFTCGVGGAVAGVLGLYTSLKAASHNGDDVSSLQKQLLCTACTQMIVGYVVFMLAISGVMMNILFLANYSSDNEEEEDIEIHLILSGCILAGIVLLLVVTILSFRSMGTCCTNPGYNQRMAQTYPTTVGTTQYYQGRTVYGNSALPQPVYSTGGFNTGHNPAYPHQQSYSMGQPPPPYGLQEASAPTEPPPSYSY